jgi:hypothetical protein
MPAPYGHRPTGPQDRTARQTSGRRRKPLPTPYHRGSPPDTPSLRGWRSSDRDPCANPDTELAEPAVREVHLHFTTDQPLRTDRKDIRYDERPDRQLRIDRRATHRRIVRCKLVAKPGQIESSIDPPHQMIFGNCVAKVKLVEHLTLVVLQTAHHGLPPPRFAPAERNHGSRHTSMTSATKSALS